MHFCIHVGPERDSNIRIRFEQRASVNRKLYFYINLETPYIYKKIVEASRNKINESVQWAHDL